MGSERGLEGSRGFEGYIFAGGPGVKRNSIGGAGVSCLNSCHGTYIEALDLHYPWKWYTSEALRKWFVQTTQPAGHSLYGSPDPCLATAYSLPSVGSGHLFSHCPVFLPHQPEVLTLQAPDGSASGTLPLLPSLVRPVTAHPCHCQTSSCLALD